MIRDFVGPSIRKCTGRISMMVVRLSDGQSDSTRSLRGVEDGSVTRLLLCSNGSFGVSLASEVAKGEDIMVTEVSRLAINALSLLDMRRLQMMIAGWIANMLLIHGFLLLTYYVLQPTTRDDVVMSMVGPTSVWSTNIGVFLQQCRLDCCVVKSYGRRYSRIGSGEDSVLVMGPFLSRVLVRIVSLRDFVDLLLSRCSEWVGWIVGFFSLWISWLC